MMSRYQKMIATTPVVAAMDAQVDEMVRQIRPLAIVAPEEALKQLLELGQEDPSRAGTAAAFAIMRLATMEVLA